MAHTARLPRYATWLTAQADSALDKALANPAVLGLGTDLIGNMDGGKNALRLSFSNTEPQRIVEGITRLKRGVTAVAP